jgi:TRAP transporter TAXI family solute receptor
MKKLLSLICVLFMCALLLVPTSATAAEISFYSATPGGSWYPIAVAAGNIWEKNIPGLKVMHKPGGGVANVIAADTGKADIGLSPSVSVGDGLTGNAPFKKKHTNIRAFASFYRQYYYITVWKDSNIHKLSDLKGKRLGAGPKGYTTEALTKKILEVVGLSYKDMAKVEFIPDQQAVDLMKDGHLDAYADTPATAQDPAQVDLSMAKPIMILEIPDNVLNTLREKSPGLFRDYVPKGSYKGIDSDVPVMSSKLGLIVRADLSEALVYKMAKVLAENWVSDMQAVSKSLAAVNPEDLAKPLGAEFHPGALKYYKERGWIK